MVTILDIVKKLNEIEEHFNNISSEEFEKVLILSGHVKNESLSESNMEFADIEKE